MKSNPREYKTHPPPTKIDIQIQFRTLGRVDKNNWTPTSQIFINYSMLLNIDIWGAGFLIIHNDSGFDFFVHLMSTSD